MMGITQLFVLSTRTMQWFEERGKHVLTYLHSDPFSDLSVLSCPVLSCPILLCPILSYPVLSSPLNIYLDMIFVLIYLYLLSSFILFHFPLSSPLFLQISTQQDLFFLTLHCSHPRENIIPQEDPRST
jgi:hypothetical protein